VPGIFLRGSGDRSLSGEGKLISDGPVEKPAPDTGTEYKTRFDTLSVPDTRFFDFPTFDFAFRLSRVNIRYDERLISMTSAGR